MHEEKDYHDIPLEIIENGRQKLEDCLLTCQAFRLAEYSLRCYLARDESFKLCHALVALYPTIPRFMKRLDDLLVQIHEGFDSVLFTSNISERNSTEYYERLLSDDQEYSVYFFVFSVLYFL